MDLKIGRKFEGKHVLFVSYGYRVHIFLTGLQKQNMGNLLNEVQDIRNMFEKFIDIELKINKLRLRLLLFLVCWYAFQAIAFRGHNESLDSINKRIFLEMLEATGTFKIDMKQIFHNTSKHALYTFTINL